jgi:ergothioneine biosynthesis protein EgtB
VSSRLADETEGSPMRTVTPLLDRYRAIRRMTEQLAEPLSPEDQTVQSMPDVSPTKWHRAHTSWFFETFLLRPAAPGYREFHPDYGFLFNSYYEAAGPRYSRSMRGCVSRPGCADISRYRSFVDERMEELIEAGLDDRSASLVELGLQHEQQHQELLLMDIKHVLSMSPLMPVYRPAPAGSSAAVPRADWVKHDGGVVEVGHAGYGFAYDNEGPAHPVYLTPFALTDRLVTCGEWLQFMSDGGYRTAALWLSDGWASVQAEGWKSPLYWQEDDGGEWSVFTLGGKRPLDPAEPVCHVSYFEADAYATWCGARLPTEFEWEAVGRDREVGGQMTDPARVHPQRQVEASFYGGAWTWTSSAYLPYPGFRPAAGAVGEYNGKFMVNQQVLRGGCCATPAGHVRPTYRNFYPASARWPFTGVRLAKDD